MATIDMPRLGAILDRESYEWLAAVHPDILEAIEAEVAAGRTAEQIRLFVVRQTGRGELAQRCEMAARQEEIMAEIIYLAGATAEEISAAYSAYPGSLGGFRDEVLSGKLTRAKIQEMAND